MKPSSSCSLCHSLPDSSTDRLHLVICRGRLEPRIQEPPKQRRIRGWAIDAIGSLQSQSFQALAVSIEVLLEVIVLGDVDQQAG